ncbi:hypothetical protein F2Q69_00014920 [Brassica cretica]|uniref:Uncharacterized protein n=1 Tax=Brassica cretica TaxID=69181 RepID=A0A8S9QFK8_BRACR|nr:hypothetical protein F2Q69_00014920 [Brassica cretica]
MAIDVCAIHLNGRTAIFSTHYKKTARILREKIVRISSEQRYSDDIPTKQVLGNNSSEFLLSSEIPRNFPTEFRRNKFPRKFRGSLVYRKSPRNIPRENFVGIFPRNFIDRCVFGHISIDRSVYKETFGIYRGTSSSEYSEEHVPRYIPRNVSLGIFRGKVSLGIFRGRCPSNSLGNSSGYSEDFIFRRNVRQNTAVFL